MATDRDTTVRKAEKLLRQGNLAAAITEYARVADAYPNDLATINKLGELYQRAGQTAEAVAQFSRIADQWLREGLYPKATGHFKKILKLNPQDEAAMLQLVQASIRQGLLEDAKAWLRTAREGREARGDTAGADELTLQLSDLDPADFAARLTALRVRLGRERTPELIKEVRGVIAELDRKNRAEEAEPLLAELIRLDPDDVDARVRVARAAMRRGDLAAARAALPMDTSGSERYEVIALAAELELTAGNADAGRPLLQRMLAVNPEQAMTEIVALGDRLRARDTHADGVGAAPAAGASDDDEGAEAHADQAREVSYICLESLVEHHAAAHAYVEAAGRLKQFLRRSPQHVPALLRLVEICVDGDLDDEATAASGQLADVYLHFGEASKSRVIAEDLVIRDPRSRAHRTRLHRALVAIGETDPDATILEIISDQLGSDADLSDDGVDLEAWNAQAAPVDDGAEAAVASSHHVVESAAPEFESPTGSAEIAEAMGVEAAPAVDGVDDGFDDAVGGGAPEALGEAVGEPQEGSSNVLMDEAALMGDVDVDTLAAAGMAPPGFGPADEAEPGAGADLVAPGESFDATADLNISPDLTPPDLHEPDFERPAAAAEAGGSDSPLLDSPEPAWSSDSGILFEPSDLSAPWEAAPLPSSSEPPRPNAVSSGGGRAAAGVTAANGAAPALVESAGAARAGQGPAPDEAPPEDADAGDLADEIDLTSALNALILEPNEPEEATGDAAGMRPAAAAADVATGGTEDDLEAVFDDLRSQAADDMVEMAQPDQSARLLSMAETYQAAGMYEEARAALEQVATDSRHRFRAAAALGQLFWQQGEADAALRWLELASEAPAPNQEAGRVVMYELAEKLEQTGETTRALAVFLDLLADQEDYRDVRARVDRLTRVQAER